MSLGEYTVAETDQIQSLDSAKILPDSLTCQPRIFSPKGNSCNTHTNISFVLDQFANVSIKVYSVSGQLVNWIAEEMVFNAGKQAIIWDGTSNNSDIVATGLYVVSVIVGEQIHSKVVNIWNY